MNQFVATAVAEELSALQTVEFFADRKACADFKAFDKLMKWRGGKPPRIGDEMQSSKAKASRHVRDNP
jgi:protein-tyrosine phosphatase